MTCVKVAFIAAALVHIILSSDVIQSGTCGSSAHYTLYGNGTMIVSGRGRMMVCSGVGKDLVQNMVINEGITTLDRSAVSYYGSLMSLQLPLSLTTMTILAISYNDNLKSLFIPKNVKAIDQRGISVNVLETIDVDLQNANYKSVGGVLFTKGNALHKFPCNHSQQYVIPDGTTEINGYAFEYCSGLKSLRIPRTVTRLGYRPFFFSTNLETVMVDSGNKNFKSMNSVLYTAGESLVFFPCGQKTSFSIPETTTSLAEGAFFGCSYLNTITIPSKITNIRGNMVDACSALRYVGVSSSNSALQSVDGVVYSKDMKSIALFPCNKTARYDIIEKTQTVGFQTFSVCNNMETITIPSSVKQIESRAFVASGMKSITIRQEVTSLGTYLFSFSSNLETVVIDARITEVANGLFYECPVLKSVSLPSSVTTIKTMAFYECVSLETVNIPPAVQRIEVSAFYNCKSLKSIVLHDKVTLLEDDAFYNCYALEGIALQSDITSVGSRAFSGCSSLKTMTISGSINSAEAICNQAGIETLNILSSVTSIGAGAFSACTSLKTVIFNGTTSPQCCNALPWDPLTIVVPQGYQGDAFCGRIVRLKTPYANGCSGCKDGQCMSISSTSYTCKECREGLIMDRRRGLCICEHGYYSDETMMCVRCPGDGCAQCSGRDGLFCMRCYPGYGSSGDGRCVVCKKGFASDGTVCADVSAQAFMMIEFEQSAGAVGMLSDELKNSIEEETGRTVLIHTDSSSAIKIYTDPYDGNVLDTINDYLGSCRQELEAL